MKRTAMQNAEYFAARRRRRTKWRRGIACLAAVVALGTVLLLMRPAVTLEAVQCGVEEHTHAAACYTQRTQETQRVLICGLAEGQPPAAPEDPAEPTEPIELTEPIESIEPAEPEEPVEPEEQTEPTEPVKPVEPAEPVEPEEPAEPIEPTELAEPTEPVEPTEPEESAEPVEPTEPEGPAEPAAPHVHTDACYDTVTVPLDTTALTCSLAEDETHTHSFLCYGTWDLTCPLSEHTHTDACRTAASAEPTPEEGSNTPDYLCGWSEHTHTEACHDEDEALVCGANAHLHTEACLTAALPSPQEQADNESAFLAALDALFSQEHSEETVEEASALLARLTEAHGLSQISDAAYLTLYAQVQSLLSEGEAPDPATVAEAAEGTNWMLLRDSGWFEEYSACNTGVSLMSAAPGDNSASSQQVDNPGGSASRDNVTVSKTIAGTELENVFDITLTVQTPQKIEEITSEPDMAVVIVMDISNTMKSKFGDSTRYKAAITAAESFLDKFAASNSMGVSKIGYVAFNTDAHEIFGLSPCTSEAQATNLKNTMRTQTGNIINQDKYAESHNRFTNVEGGLKMASDMLSRASNKNKFIIFLSDGFPTTYLSHGYNGYDPYTPNGTIGNDGVFYDAVLRRYCGSGTSYSNKAAIRAREMAVSIKNGGTTIFSIGVDVGGQTIAKYVEQSEAFGDISIVDRTDINYEIGDAESPEAYKNWLKNSIGSGYYYDSTDTSGLSAAYDDIFQKIKTTVETASKADWVAEDPVPSVTPDDVEFIGLYNKDGTLQPREGRLEGQHVENAENTAFCELGAESQNDTIHWDLKESGYTATAEGDTTWYHYSLRYRVRLRNEDSDFVESSRYNTNNTTTLQYRVVQTQDGSISISDPKTIEFPIPTVHGYLGELRFTKIDTRNSPLAGAEFTLCHADSCTVCRGDGTAVTIASQVATSDTDGTVTFTNIPSGHVYTLTETGIPPGYSASGNHYTVTVAYDVVTVTVTDYNHQPVDGAWDSKNPTIVNNFYYELPATGGIGTHGYTAAGLLLCAAAALGLCSRKRRRRGASP